MKYIKFNKLERKLLLLICDIILTYNVLFIYTNFVLRGKYIYKAHSYNLYIYTIGFSLFLLLAYILDIYNLQRALKTRTIISLSFITYFSFNIILFLITVFLFNTTVSRPYLILFLFSPLLFSFWRLIIIKLFNSSLFFRKTIYITDMKNIVNERTKLIEGEGQSNGYVVKLSTITNEPFNKTYFKNNLYNIDTIILDISNYNLVNKELESVIIKGMLHGKEVRTFLSFYENTYEAIPIELNKTSFYDSLQLKKRQGAYLQVLFSKIIDIGLSFFVGIVFLVVAPFVWLMNIFFNRGPLFYTQKRVGKRGEEFDVYKFRSMVTNAEKSGAKMAVKNDSRITPFGKILRKFRIDELPQIISVIKGDMSFIGPRPERKVFVDQLNEMTPFYNVRHLVKPGITGWAQVKYKYGENLQDSINKLEYDLYYIKNRSITLDIRIIFKTVTTVLFSRGV